MKKLLLWVLILAMSVSRIMVFSLGGCTATKAKIVFVSDREGNLDIYTMNVDGSEQVRLTNNPAAEGGPSFSP
ncbi:MAG: PD40 domain-containing protein [Actinobacteria bacterium]|nr:PD40 domain-containing protein [Chloroflexota bacterium]MBE3128348.1 PD40 domain-containing protein [Actinomycetota bacterium]